MWNPKSVCGFIYRLSHNILRGNINSRWLANKTLWQSQYIRALNHPLLSQRTACESCNDCSSLQPTGTAFTMSHVTLNIVHTSMSISSRRKTCRRAVSHSHRAMTCKSWWFFVPNYALWCEMRTEGLVHYYDVKRRGWKLLHRMMRMCKSCYKSSYFIAGKGSDDTHIIEYYFEMVICINSAVILVWAAKNNLWCGIASGNYKKKNCDRSYFADHTYIYIYSIVVFINILNKFLNSLFLFFFINYIFFSNSFYFFNYVYWFLLEF